MIIKVLLALLKQTAVKVFKSKCNGPKIAHQSNLAQIENQGLKSKTAYTMSWVVQDQSIIVKSKLGLRFEI